MIEFRLSIDALGNTRFAYSPLGEIAGSLRALGAGQVGYAMQPWLREVRGRVGSVDMDLLGAVAPPGLFAPNFLFTWSTDPKITIKDQLDQLAALPVEVIKRDLAVVWRGGPFPPRLTTLLDHDPASVGSQLADALWRYWVTMIAPYWSRIRAVVDDDVSHRVGRLLGGGLYDLLADLHPEVALHGATLAIDKPHHADAVYADAELTLIPSVFVWPNLIIGHDTPGHFELIYAARGVARVWETSGAETGDDVLGALVGRTRASILRRLVVPMATTHLARELGQSPATVSAHLSVLRRSGLLTTRRSGRLVLYWRTPLAASIVAAAEEQESTG